MTAGALFDRVPPHDEAMERHVLGAMLLDYDSAALACEELVPEDFYSTVNGKIFDAARKARLDKGALDISLLRAELEARGELAAVGGGGYLLDCITGCPTSAHTEWYIREAKNRSVLRRIVSIATGAARDAYDINPDEALDYLVSVEGRFAALSKKIIAPKTRTIDDALEEVIAQIQAGAPNAIPTGIPALDRMLDGGLAPGTLTFVGAYRSVGKTAFGSAVALHAMRRGKRVVWIAAEMSDAQMTRRWLTALSGRSLRAVDLTGEAPERVRTSIADAVAFLATHKPVIEWRDTRVSHLALSAKRFKERGELDLLCIDHLQILRHEQAQGENEYAAMTRTVHALKQLASELAVPILCMSQCRARGDVKAKAYHHRPNMSDLKGTGSIEEDADAVVLLWPDAQDYSVMHVALDKNRHGPTGSFDIFADFGTMKLGERRKA